MQVRPLTPSEVSTMNNLGILPRVIQDHWRSKSGEAPLEQAAHYQNKSRRAVRRFWRLNLFSHLVFFLLGSIFGFAYGDENWWIAIAVSAFLVLGLGSILHQVFTQAMERSAEGPFSKADGFGYEFAVLLAILKLSLRDLAAVQFDELQTIAHKVLVHQAKKVIEAERDQTVLTDTEKGVITPRCEVERGFLDQQYQICLSFGLATKTGWGKYFEDARNELRRAAA